MTLSRYIQFERQATFDSDAFGAFGANYHLIDETGEDISGDHQYIYPQTTMRTRRKRILGPKKFGGPIDTPLYTKHAVTLLHYLLGSTTTTTGTPNTHVIKTAKSIPFFRAAIGRDIREHRYVGGIINSVSIDYNPEEVLSASFETVFRRELATAPLSSGLGFADFDNLEAAFGGVEVTPKLDSVTTTAVESASITIENNVYDDIFSVGNQYLPAGLIAAHTVTGSFDLRFDSDSSYNDWLNGTNRRFELIATRGVGASQREIHFDLPSISYDTTKLPTENIERYVQAIEFTGETNDPIIITVKNEQTNAQFTG